MLTIHKLTLHDEEMRPVAVQIPYEEWLEIEKALTNHKAGAAASDIEAFRGAIRLNDDPLEIQRRMRDEW